MEQKKSDRAARGSNAWQPQARQQELDEADRFQVAPPLLPAPSNLPFLVLALPPNSVISATSLVLLFKTLQVLSLRLNTGRGRQ